MLDVQLRTDCSSFEVRRSTFKSADVSLPLAWIALDPAICLDRILPEILLGDVAALRREVFVDQTEDLQVRSDGIAIGPVATVDEAVRAEGFKNLVQLRFISGQIRCDLAVGP